MRIHNLETRERMSESTEDVAQEEIEAPDNQEDAALLDGNVDDSLLDGDDNPPAEEEDPVRDFACNIYYMLLGTIPPTAC